MVQAKAPEEGNSEVFEQKLDSGMAGETDWAGNLQGMGLDRS